MTMRSATLRRAAVRAGSRGGRGDEGPLHRVPHPDRAVSARRDKVAAVGHERQGDYRCAVGADRPAVPARGCVDDLDHAVRETSGEESQRRGVQGTDVTTRRCPEFRARRCRPGNESPVDSSRRRSRRVVPTPQRAGCGTPRSEAARVIQAVPRSRASGFRDARPAAVKPALEIRPNVGGRLVAKGHVARHRPRHDLLEGPGQRAIDLADRRGTR